jgi:hypothetical protein
MFSTLHLVIEVLSTHHSLNVRANHEKQTSPWLLRHSPQILALDSVDHNLLCHFLHAPNSHGSRNLQKNHPPQARQEAWSATTTITIPNRSL